MISLLPTIATLVAASASDRLHRPGASERGANLVEYAILIAVIAVVAVFAIAVVGQATVENIEGVKPGFGK